MGFGRSQEHPETFGVSVESAPGFADEYVSPSTGKARAQGMIEALDLVQCGALLVDGDGRVIQYNSSAQRYLGTVISVMHGQLIGLDCEANAALQLLVRRLVTTHPKESAGGTTMLFARSEQHPVLACAVRLRPDGADAAQSPTGLVILVDPNQQRAPAEYLLRLAFSLTPAEIRLAIGLLKGMSMQQIARLHGLSVGTLRNQLKTVFAKTRTRRQSELTVLLGRMAILAE
jgi:DNA-binding CsgD family transcriptional regulator